MNKEIERKWVIQPTFDINKIIVGKEYTVIKDHYFNRYSRLRYTKKNNDIGKWCITIKGDGTIVRDEYEFELDKNKLDFIPTPTLNKKRYTYEYKGNKFEVNVFENISLIFRDVQFDVTDIPRPLVLVELEMNNKDQHIDIPEWFGNEVTYDKAMYGWHLFEQLKEEV